MKTNVDLLLIKNHSVLLQLRDNIASISWPGYWNIPGGTVEAGETIEQAIRREYIEETGYTLHNPVAFKTYVHNNSWGKPIKRHVLYEYYDDVQPIHCYEGAKMEFIHFDKISKLKIIPHDFESIKDVQAALFQP